MWLYDALSERGACRTLLGTAALSGVTMKKKHDVPEALLASLLSDYKKPEDLIGENGLLQQNNSSSGR